MEGRYINPYKQAGIASLTPEERFNYEESMKVYRDLINVVRTAERKGVEKGRAEGIAEGIQHNKLENARKMKTDGMSPKLIVKYTGLTFEEVKKL